MPSFRDSIIPSFFHHFSIIIPSLFHHFPSFCQSNGVHCSVAGGRTGRPKGKKSATRGRRWSEARLGTGPTLWWGGPPCCTAQPAAPAKRCRCAAPPRCVRRLWLQEHKVKCIGKENLACHRNPTNSEHHRMALLKSYQVLLAE